MRVKNFIIVCALFSVNTLMAQNDIKIILEFKMTHVVDTTQRQNPRVSPCMLIAGSEVSIFDDYYKSRRFLGFPMSRVYNNPFDVEDFVNGVSIDQVYTDFKNREITTGAYILKVLYTKTEPLPKIDWKIQSATKKIMEENCQMATAWVKGRHYTAWFAPGIPISAGPWKLNGLPGIILAANDDKNEVSFLCTKMTMPEKDAPQIALSKKAERMSVEEFEKTRKAYELDPSAFRAPSDDPRGTRVSFSASPSLTAIMQEPGYKSKPRPTNNPIEKEK